MKIGALVTRYKYNHDVVFKIIDISNNVAILQGVCVRLSADAPLSDLKIYDKEEYFEHGEDKTFEIKLPKGSHQLEFNGNDDTEIEKLKIDDDTKVKYKLECLSGGIEVTQVSRE